MCVDFIFFSVVNTSLAKSQKFPGLDTHPLPWKFLPQYHLINTNLIATNTQYPR